MLARLSESQVGDGKCLRANIGFAQAGRSCTTERKLFDGDQACPFHRIHSVKGPEDVEFGPSSRRASEVEGDGALRAVRLCYVPDVGVAEIPDGAVRNRSLGGEGDVEV